MDGVPCQTVRSPTVFSTCSAASVNRLSSVADMVGVGTEAIVPTCSARSAGEPDGTGRAGGSGCRNCVPSPAGTSITTGASPSAGRPQFAQKRPFNSAPQDLQLAMLVVRFATVQMATYAW